MNLFDFVYFIIFNKNKILKINLIFNTIKYYLVLSLIRIKLKKQKYKWINFL